MTTDAAVNPDDIRIAAMDLLARREHSLRELRDKLRRRFADEVMLDAELSRLVSQRLQCDLRFAQSYARQRISRGYGPLRLREELRQRGVCKDDIQSTLDSLEVDWSSQAARVLQNRFGAQPPRDLKERAQRARFMAYRGFRADHYLSDPGE